MQEIGKQRGHVVRFGGQRRRGRKQRDDVFPHDLDAERAVLGGCLVSNEAITRLPSSLRPEHFYRAAHRQIFSRIMALHESGTGVDFITVKDALGDELEDVGGAMLLGFAQ